MAEGVGPNSFMFSLPLLIPPLILPQNLQSIFLLYFSPLDIPRLTPTSAMQSKSNQFSQRHRSTSAHQRATNKKPHLYIQWSFLHRFQDVRKAAQTSGGLFSLSGVRILFWPSSKQSQLWLLLTVNISTRILMSLQYVSLLYSLSWQSLLSCCYLAR